VTGNSADAGIDPLAANDFTIIDGNITSVGNAYEGLEKDGTGALYLIGTNITGPYTQWLTDVRKAAPHARIFAVVPLMGKHRNEITAAVKAQNAAGDARVYLIDLPELQPWFHYTQGGTAFAHEGVHPTGEGHAHFAVHLAVKVQKFWTRIREF
jgi:hypothetical protein